MPPTEFKTVPDELLHVAVALRDHLADQGYDVQIETSSLGFPFTPTFNATRGHENLIVELSTLLPRDRLSRWVKYCRSQSADTRLCAAVSYGEAHKAETAEFCQAGKIGLWTFKDGVIAELRDPVDLAVHVELPELREIRAKLRPFLADPFKKISRGEWRDGLGDIYLAIEDRAREYLKEGIERTRIVSVTKKGNVLSSNKVDGMTMGQLAIAFSNIQSQNQQDSLIAGTLHMINPTRVKLTHKRLQKKAEEEIRRDVGKHVWAAINCLDEILK